ncbi:TonB-dependent receptor [Mucilaginibacter sp. Mucisp84]|uniref:TonB-dependent receptor n=1 Tax=Mucilaginibacter sp. Mucisp84 TaxID=3243058 RepID=UPI0039A4B450
MKISAFNIGMPQLCIPKKLLLVVKITTLVLLVAIMQVSASSYAQRINLSETNVSLKKLFKEIRKQSGYNFIYTESMMKGAKSVDIHVSNAAIVDILDKVFHDQPLSYTISNNTIVIKEKESAVSDNILSFIPITVTGTVKDEKGEPLPGVTVVAEGSSNAVSTDSNGKYTIKADSKQTLVFSFVGYKTVKRIINNESVIDISLEPLSKDLSEVVVVGYGTQKKVNLTGAVASVGADKLESRPITNLGDGLNGLIPNLNVNLNNGQPGTGASYNVRGYTSISGSPNPLILVDGVQRDPNLIDPNDVASVTVLKDAASAAIYGGRAAFGVVLITTKNAKKGAMQISYSGSYTTSRPTKIPDYINSKDYLNMFNAAQRSGAQSGGYTSNDPFTAQDSTMIMAYFNDPAHNPSAYVDPGNPQRYRYVGNTNWIKVLYPGWAPQQQHYLSVSGGEGKTTYSANMGYFTQDGLEKVANQVYKRYTPSLKIVSEVAKWLTFNFNMSMTHTDNNQSAYTNQSNQGGAWIPNDLRPLMPVYNPDGNYSGQGNYTNPVAVIKQNGRDINSENDFWTTGRIILTPVKHLTVTSDYTWNSYTAFDREQVIPFNEYGVNGAFLNIFPHTNPSRVSEYRHNDNYNAFNAYATYENTFGTKNYFKALAGYNQEYFHYVLSNATARNLIDPTLPAIGTNNDPKPTVGGAETQSALIGSFFRLNYIYDKKYLLEVNGRYDGTSRFPADHRYAFSPSVSAGWNVAEEGFMDGLKTTINELKLRASYGQLPNQQGSSGVSSSAQYPYIATQNTGTVGYLFNNQPGVTVNAPGLISTNLTWEKVQTKNIGLDYALLNSRLSGSFDYFITDTKNMLVAGQQLPGVLGTGAPLRNAADLRTKGWELSISWKDRVFNNQLFYSATLGLSDSRSTITRYDLNPTLSIGDYYPGQKLGNIWGFVSDGFYKTDADAAKVDNSALAGYTWLAGDIKYADLNHDGKISYGNNTVTNPGDQKIIGNTTPRYRFGLNLNLAFKNFDFAAFFQGVLKADFVPNDYVFYGFKGNEWNIPYAYATDYWTPQNPNAYFARPRFNGSGNQQTQTMYLQNAAYCRIKQLTLGYSLPLPLISKISLHKVRVYVTGANLFTITSMFKGYDPEIVSNGGNFGTYPINKSVSFGLQATL